MKIRNGFVTNSSSTSYVCEITGQVSETVMDTADPSELGYVTCDNEHRFLEEFVIEDAKPNLTPEQMKQEMFLFYNNSLLDSERYQLNRDYYKNMFLEKIKEIELLRNDSDILRHYTDYCVETKYGNIREWQCPICTFQVYSQSEMTKYLLKKYGIPESEAFEVVKKVNKRRKKLYPEEYIKYVFDKVGLNDDTVMKQLRGEFSSYNEYRKYVYDGQG